MPSRRWSCDWLLILTHRQKNTTTNLLTPKDRGSFILVILTDKEHHSRGIRYLVRLWSEAGRYDFFLCSDISNGATESEVFFRCKLHVEFTVSYYSEYCMYCSVYYGQYNTIKWTRKSWGGFNVLVLILASIPSTSSGSWTQTLKVMQL